MKKIIRLTESDLTRIVKRVIMENEKNKKTVADFEEFENYVGLPVTPDIYKSGDFIALNFLENQKAKFTITYKEGDDKFDIIIVTKPNTGLCEKVKNSCQSIESQGSIDKNKYNVNKDTCGCQTYFNLNSFDKIPNLIKSVYKNLNSWFSQIKILKTPIKSWGFFFLLLFLKQDYFLKIGNKLFIKKGKKECPIHIE